MPADRAMLFDLDLPTLLTRLFILVTAFSVHEFAHAWVANSFGDDTPRLYGRLTLNPVAHLDVMGSLMLLFAGFGWAKPVPINPYVLRRHSAAAVMWVSLAGPLSNLLMAILAAIPFKIGLVQVSFTGGEFLPTLPQFLLEFIFINLLLMLFNLIPLFPLDGEKVLDYFLPPQQSQFLENIRPYSPMILFAIVFVGPALGLNIIQWIISPPLQLLLRLLIGL
jgi:Zn-dependent protease